MEKQNNVPKLRFPEFSDAWEMKKLGEICESISSGKSKLNDVSFKFPFYGSTGIIGYSENFDYSGKNILIARVGANAGSLYKVNGNYSVSDNTLILNLFKNIEPDFIYYFLKYSNLNKLVFGSGQPLITGGQLKGLKLNIPTLQEQQKIATFLSTVDEKLQALKKKKSLLETYKKGVMQKLFSQKIRFKDDEGNDFEDWKMLNGNLIFESISDRNHNSDLPILAITQEFGAIPRNLIDYQVSVTDKSVETYKVVDIGDFIISLRSFQGGIEYSNYRGICSPAYIILRPHREVNRNFYKSYLKTEEYIKQLNKNLEGIRDGKMISYKYFSEIELPFPSLPEQTKIANFLTAIDEKLNKVDAQIKQTELWKRGLLQQMFV